MRTAFGLTAGLVLGASASCSTNHPPSLVEAYVSCDSYAPDDADASDTWSFTAFVEDPDGLDEIDSVKTSLIDFDGQEVAVVSLDNVDDGYWARTLSSDDFYLGCDLYDSYLYQFVACDQSGACDRMEAFP